MSNIAPNTARLFRGLGLWNKLPSLADRIDASGDCWEWMGPQTVRGYGQVGIDAKKVFVHRFVWESLVGPIPAGLQIDHLCRNIICCNPDHLEVVTLKENCRRGYSPAAKHGRKTHCPQGHPYSGDNLYVGPKGNRKCRQCSRASNRRWYARLK